MSKPVSRIVFALLISLIIIAAIATTVQARLGSGSPTTLAAQHVSGQTHMSMRASSSSMQYQFENLDPGSGHDCGSPDSSADD